MVFLETIDVDIYNALAVLLIPMLLWAALSRDAGASLVITCWIIAGVSMTVINKKAAQAFDAMLLLVIAQMLIADCIICVAYFQNLRLGRWSDLIHWMLVPLSFSSILATGIWSLKEATTSTVLIFRNILPLVTFVVERWLIDSSLTVSMPLISSMLVTLTGTIIYGFWSVAVTPFGVFLVLLNDFIMVFDKLLQRHLLKNPDFSMSLPMCMLLNNTVGMLPILVLSVMTGELWRWPLVIETTSPFAWLMVLLSGVLGCCLGYLALQVQRLVAATTFIMLQNLSKILGICLGIIILGDPVTTLSAIGCILSVAGSAWYSYISIQSKKISMASTSQQARETMPSGKCESRL